MAYYYVKSGLTGTGDQGRYASQQTGAFPTGTGGYGSIAAAFAATTAPTSGDYICVSDTHTNTTGAVQTWSGPSSGASLTILSVADANCDQYSAGASEKAASASANDINMNGLLVVMGIDLTPADHMIFSFGNFRFIDLALSTFSGNTLSLGSDGANVELIDCTYDYKAATEQMVSMNNGGRFAMCGGSLTSSAGGDGLVDKVSASGFTGGGGKIELIGVDLSIVDGTLFADTGSSVSVDDRTELIVDRCKLHANVSGVEEALVSSGSYLRITNSSSDSAAAEYQFQYTSRGGDVNEETEFYRDGSTAFPDSNQKISLKCVTDALPSRTDPFAFDFPSRFAALSAAASDNLTIYILSSTTLTNSDVWAEVVYPDGTTKQLPNTAWSIADAFDPFRTGATLDTNTEAWTGRTTENRYQIDIDTSTDAGADCYPIVRVYVAKASTTIYFDSEVVLS